MKRIALWCSLVALCPVAWGTAYVTVGSGSINWNVAGNWSPAVIPGCGDTVTIATTTPATVLHVPNGYAACAGAWPADDTGTPALQCASASTGTGSFIVDTGGDFTYRAGMRGCNGNTIFQPGSHIHYDASGAATPASALYVWNIGGANTQANAVLLSQGTSGSHVTIDSVGGFQSGGFGNSGTAFTDGGRAEFTYTDVSNCGPATTTGFCVSYRLSTAAGRFICQNTTFTSSADIGSTTSIGAASVFQMDKCNISAPANTAFALQITATTARTTGTRSITNSTIQGLSQLDATGGNSGFTFQNVLFSKVFSQSTGGLSVRSGTSITSWSEVFLYDNGAVDPGYAPPAGNNTYVYLFRHCSLPCGNPNPIQVSHPAATSYIFDHWIFEYDGSDHTGDMVNPRNDCSAACNIKQQYSIFLPASDGGVIGSYLTNSSGVAQTNTTYTWIHNTAYGGGSAGTTVYGLGWELAGTSVPAGAVTALEDNIIWESTPGAGYLSNSQAVSPVNSAAFTVVDYNIEYNINVGPYGIPAAAFASSGAGGTPAGTHDQSINPQFVDTTRSMGTADVALFGNALQPTWVTSTAYNVGDQVSVAVSTFYGNQTINYRCVTAHTSGATTKPGSGSAWATDWDFSSVKDVSDAILAGTTYNGGADHVVGYVIKWIDAGYAPTNAAIATAASDGTTPGAVPFQSTSSPKANSSVIF